jgi:hypothetical protein
VIPTPSTLLDTNNKPRWDVIKSIPKTDILLPEELLPDTKFRKTLDQELARNLVRLQLPETGFLSQLAVWLIDNLKQYHHKKILPVFSLANRLARIPPNSFPGFEEIEGSYFLPSTPIVKFWTASVEAFGSVYLPVNLTNIIFSKSDAPIPITPLGKIYNKHDPNNPAT